MSRCQCYLLVGGTDRWDKMGSHGRTNAAEEERERERGKDAGERFAPDTVLRQTDRRAGSASSHHENRSCCSPLAQSCPSSPAGQGLQSALHSPLVPTPQTGSWRRGEWSTGQEGGGKREGLTWLAGTAPCCRSVS